MKQALRHAKILEIINEQKFISTEGLVAILGVTPQTIRRDLNIMMEQNLITRHHGGASSATSSQNSDYQDRVNILSIEKLNIAREVVKIIPDFASLFIDIGTSAEAVARELINHRGLKIVTNNINVAQLFANKSDFRVTLSGGDLRSDGALLGSLSQQTMEQFRLDYGILGISGIDYDGCLLDFDYQETLTKKIILHNSKNRILVADHSKYGRSAMVNLGPMNEVDYFFTNKTPPNSIIKVLSEHNVKLYVCDNNNLS